MTIPILIALAFAVAATLEWPRRPLAARLHLAAASAYVVGAVDHVGARHALLAAAPHDGIGWVLLIAGALALAALVACAGVVALTATTARR